MPPEAVKEFGASVPMKRPGQPAELAPAYVMLASDEASYVSGATVAVTGGMPVIGARARGELHVRVAQTLHRGAHFFQTRPLPEKAGADSAQRASATCFREP